MEFVIQKSSLGGGVRIPGSKSHTVRALVFGLLAEGESVIEEPLVSSDTESCAGMVACFGARVERQEGVWRVNGIGGSVPVPDDVVDVGNSGTSLYIGMGVAALAEGYTVFTGDAQIRNRPVAPLGDAIRRLGGEVISTRRNGLPPVVVKGKIAGGKTRIEAVTSQYLTSLLMAAPLANRDTHIHVPLLNERPYVDMTMAWLDRLGISYQNRDYRAFNVKGKQRYRAFRERIPADFSSATFFLVAAAITGSELTLQGLDFNDTQGDREVVNILKGMGAEIELGERSIIIRGKGLTGGTFDLNSIPDALPALAVAGCAASGETRLVNVPQARVKETDRIAVMRSELAKMGARIEELPDGLVIRGGGLRGCALEGRGDHRVAMALSVAGLIAEGTTRVNTAESVSVTFPNFFDLMKGAGADIARSDG
ncbi:MAG: 3-phosphoshikimate 1-carboxyvinyltransferase [Spirochaetes bacterium]|nr:3-phosphoshikimate 1-carboxyvinyltransferase [Spirochaetota bacterium]